MLQLARCVTDLSMHIMEVNEAFADLLHERSETLEGKNIYDITHPDDLAFNRRLLDRLRHDGTPFSITKRYTRADGSTVWVNNHVSLYGSQIGANALVATVQQVERPASTIDEHTLLKTAQWMLLKRSIRPKFFGLDIFGEPQFDMLLDLYINGMMKRPVSISSACLASGVPATTALRYIAGLVERGWLKRCDDPNDKRRSTLLLSAECADRMTRYLGECAKE